MCFNIAPVTMTYLVLVIFLAIASATDHECYTKEGIKGICKGVDSCPFLFQKYNTTPIVAILQQYGGCGRVNNNVNLCCPVDTSSSGNTGTLGDRVSSSLHQTTSGTPLALSCPSPYRSIGGRCLFFNSVEKSQYSEMRNLCRGLGGDLVQIDDANLHVTIVQFIRKEGLTAEKFWIGANDLEEEGVWRWPDGSLVRMGTPSWGYLTEPEIKYEPSAGHPNEHCGCLIKYWLYFFHDCICDEHNSVICEHKPASTKP